MLINGWKRAFGSRGRIELDESLLEWCCEHVLDSWTAKRTLADITRKLADHDPDWSPNFTRLFLKSQVVKKAEKVNTPASAGQIVATFTITKTFRDAVWALYVEKYVLALMPSNVYLHCRRTPDEMSSWLAEQPVPDAYSANDYTAWDSGVDGAFLTFDAWLLTSLGVPMDYIQTFIAEREETRCYAGPIRLMQFSGDRWTWLLNTCRNVALTNYSVTVPSGTPQMYSGDDSLLFGVFPANPKFNHRDWLMSPKPVVTRHFGSFCGFRVSQGVISYDPHYMRARIEYAIADRPNDLDLFRSLIDQAAYMSDLDIPFNTTNALLRGLYFHIRDTPSLHPLLNSFTPLSPEDEPESYRIEFLQESIPMQLRRLQ
jgi:hypothetical protein